MLAKMWKKVLLAICIIACIFNLMSKLVNRHSLETNLRSVNDGNTVIDSIKNQNLTTNDVSNSSSIIDNESTVNNDDNLNNEEKVIEDEENVDSDNTDAESDSVYKASDFRVIF